MTARTPSARGIGKALGDPVRLTQQTISHHLKVLREAGIAGSRSEGIWAYCYLERGALAELSGRLT